MNVKLLLRLLGMLSLLIGSFMLASLIWANPQIGFQTDAEIITDRFEKEGFRGLFFSTIICAAIGGILLLLGKGAQGRLFRKEAMAVVGLSWVLATVLGALPYVLSGVYRGPSIRVYEETQQVFVVAPQYKLWQTWIETDVTPEQFSVLQAIAKSTARGIRGVELQRATKLTNSPEIFLELGKLKPFQGWLIAPGQADRLAPADRASNYRMRWVRMNVVDAMFESQSGFSTTGATMIADLQDPHLVPRCILFWRASTQFLGGLGIIVLFVAILGQGSAGKALMRAEVPGPTLENMAARMQHTAWLFASIYVGLNLILAVTLLVLGMSPFDAICHAFTTLATGGFSTYNASIGHFASLPGISGAAIEYTVIAFMILGGANFTLLAFCLFGQPGRLFRDIEWRAYIGIICVSTIAVMAYGMFCRDAEFQTFFSSFRYGLFQVVSILTTTGFVTSNFDLWNQFSRGLLLLLMFIGGCAGSTAGSVKVIRHVLFIKILGMELEHSFHPKVVRLLRLGGKPVENETLRHTILVYFALILILFAIGSLLVVAIEPDATWGANADNKLIDSASAVCATLNNIGPGLGTVGATQNYGHFGVPSKTLFIFLMMLGRLEIFPILVLLAPKFWRDQ